MNDDDVKIQLQKFADANNISVDIESMISNISAGDYVSLLQAMENNDSRSIIKLIHQYKAKLSENFKVFSKLHPSNEYNINYIQECGHNDLVPLYKTFVQGALYECDYLSTSELRTLIYEDFSSTQQIVNNNNNAQQTVDTVTSNQDKIDQIMRNQQDPNFRVSTVDNGTTDIKKVVGIETTGTDPDNTLVAMSDPNAMNGQLDIRNLSDINMVDSNIHEDDESTETTSDGTSVPMNGDEVLLDDIELIPSQYYKEPERSSDIRHFSDQDMKDMYRYLQSLEKPPEPSIPSDNIEPVQEPTIINYDVQDPRNSSVDDLISAVIDEFSTYNKGSNEEQMTDDIITTFCSKG